LAKEGAIARIHSFQRFGSRLGLERMSALMALLGDPQDDLRVIHVAGTNGKGSVCRYIYEILRKNGYRTGIYTSPFIESFHERIEFDGALISDEDLDACTDLVMERVDHMLASGMDSPTEFEVLTAIAFVYFAKQDMDFLVLETGLGGGGDSTNVVKRPLATAITSISLDHTDRLGESVRKIAAEKAGIIKKNAPVAVNVDGREAAEVIAQVALEKDAPLIDASKFRWRCLESSTEGCVFSAEIMGRAYDEMRISMAGRHQVRNAVCALTVIELMRANGYIRVTREGVLAGLSAARLPGRFEIFRGGPDAMPVIMDGAHNEAGAEALADAMEELFPGERVLVLMGVLRDKLLHPMLTNLNRFSSEYIATEPANDRKLTALSLRAAIKGTGKACAAFSDAGRALDEAFRRRGEFGAILITGSLYLIGDLRRETMERVEKK
jgi:dihydrofolate synthase/folylpolyglutamate synthase